MTATLMSVVIIAQTVDWLWGGQPGFVSWQELDVKLSIHLRTRLGICGIYTLCPAVFHVMVQQRDIFTITLHVVLIVPIIW
jgi:hypothetical protein